MINILNKSIKNNYIVICDHASNYIPDEYDNLNLDDDTLKTHIAYDIGAKEVASNIANHLQCPLIMSDFSRLLIDANRGIDDPTLIMKISDGRIIQGNKNISYLAGCEEKMKRIKSYYNTYHNKISDIINLSIEREVFPAIISIHSFTPVFNGKKRLTDLGILWDSDDRLPNIFFQYLRLNNKDINIVTEWYLWEIMTNANISRDRIIKQRESLIKIYEPFFLWLKNIDFKWNIVICFPFWNVKWKYTYFEEVYDILEKYCNIHSLLDEKLEISATPAWSLLYKRDKQLVWREIFKLTIK